LIYMKKCANIQLVIITKYQNKDLITLMAEHITPPHLRLVPPPAASAPPAPENDPMPPQEPEHLRYPLDGHGMRTLGVEITEPGVKVDLGERLPPMVIHTEGGGRLYVQNKVIYELGNEEQLADRLSSGEPMPFWELGTEDPHEEFLKDEIRRAVSNHNWTMATDMKFQLGSVAAERDREASRHMPTAEVGRGLRLAPDTVTARVTAIEVQDDYIQEGDLLPAEHLYQERAKNPFKEAEDAIERLVYVEGHPKDFSDERDDFVPTAEYPLPRLLRAKVAGWLRNTGADAAELAGVAGDFLMDLGSAALSQWVIYADKASDWFGERKAEAAELSKRTRKRAKRAGRTALKGMVDAGQALAWDLENRLEESRGMEAAIAQGVLKRARYVGHIAAGPVVERAKTINSNRQTLTVPGLGNPADYGYGPSPHPDEATAKPDDTAAGERE
jgi:hypothetical protein